jgi:hypothetical protein
MLLHAGHAHDNYKHAGTRAVPICKHHRMFFNNSEHIANLFGLSGAVGYVYTRLNNPTIDVHKLAFSHFENGRCSCSDCMEPQQLRLHLWCLLKQVITSLLQSSLYERIGFVTFCSVSKNGFRAWLPYCAANVLCNPFCYGLMRWFVLVIARPISTSYVSCFLAWCRK